MMRSSEEKLPISVVILTKNESEVVAEAIASVRDNYVEVIVLDSFSDDDTVEISKAAGAQVVQNEFKGYASQRNFALHQIEKRSEWVLFLDADERMSPELTAELHQGFSHYSSSSYGLLYMRRKDFFMGRWIKRSSGYPTWFGRLCHAPAVRVEREINEEYHCTGSTARLQGHLLHYPFAKGLTHWLDRHNRYSTAEASTKAENKPINPRLIFSPDPGLRRKGLKEIYMRMPFRPLVGFLYLYIVRGGFLDGRPGLRYALLRAFYDFMISIKFEELQSPKATSAKGEK